MKSFFSSISSYFSSTYGGRYISIIISEIAKEEPIIMNCILGNNKFNKDKHIVATEYCYKKGRRADIAILSKANNKIISLIEVKYEDENNDNCKQLEDYIGFAKEHKCDFVYLTQYYPPDYQLELVKSSGYKHVLFSDVAKNINNICSDFKLCQLFVKYIEERGLMFNEEIDTNAFRKFLLRSFNPWNGHGKIQCNDDMIENSQKSFSEIMKNIDVVANGLLNFIPNTGRRPTIDFTMEQFINLSKIPKEDRENGDEIALPAKSKTGGKLYCFARFALNQEQLKRDNFWLYISFGFVFTVEKGKKDYITEVYSEIDSKQLNNICLYEPVKVNNTIVNKEKLLIKKIREVLRKVTDKALLNEDMGCHKQKLLELKNINN